MELRRSEIDPHVLETGLVLLVSDKAESLHIEVEGGLLIGDADVHMLESDNVADFSGTDLRTTHLVPPSPPQVVSSQLMSRQHPDRPSVEHHRFEGDARSSTSHESDTFKAMIRLATNADVPVLIALINDLAAYERDRSEVEIDAAMLEFALFSTEPSLFARVATDDSADI